MRSSARARLSLRARADLAASRECPNAPPPTLSECSPTWSGRCPSSSPRAIWCRCSRTWCAPRPPLRKPPHFAKLRLSELIVGDAPFRAARLARDVLVRGESDRAWAVLGLAHTLLGNYRVAARSYRRALALAPDCGVYEHNLGHVLDVALNRPQDACRTWSARTALCPKRARSPAPTRMPCSVAASWTKRGSCSLLAVKSPQEADEIFKAWQYANGNTAGPVAGSSFSRRSA